MTCPPAYWVDHVANLSKERVCVELGKNNGNHITLLQAIIHGEIP